MKVWATSHLADQILKALCYLQLHTSYFPRNWSSQVSRPVLEGEQERGLSGEDGIARKLTRAPVDIDASDQGLLVSDVLSGGL